MVPLALAAIKAAPALIEGGVNLYQNYKGAKGAKSDQALAQESFDRSKANYFNQDISNPYANAENVYEDLTVNTQAADFTAQQQNQGMANTMGSLRQSAGGSGIAALAQSLASQQSLNAGMASASIANQEQGNQQLVAGESARLQGLENNGELYSRRMKADLMGTQLGMDQIDLTESTTALQGFNQGMAGGVGTMAGGVMDGVESYMNAKKGGGTGTGKKPGTTTMFG